jgi:hypothetical protein
MHFSAFASRTNRAAIAQCGAQTTASPLFLSEHVRCCEFRDGAVILDLDRNDYLGIDAEQLYSLQSRVENWPRSSQGGGEVSPKNVSTSATLISDLLARGILTTVQTVKPSTLLGMPETALIVADVKYLRRRVPIGHVVSFVSAVVFVALRLRKNGLPPLLRWLRRHQSTIEHGHAATSKKAQQGLASFLWLRTWFYTAQRRCLFDSLVMSIYLTKRHVACTFVIGVTTKPFLAHAWVQIDGAVLNDTVEHAQEFRAILNVDGR